jgi:cellulose synthase/poly-beta-1,6-N-acetylglucosamine synthase-like glycosyltransferase
VIAVERVSVLVPVYRGSRQLEGLLEALGRDPYPDKEVIVCVDAPDEETKALEESHPWAHFDWCDERRGKVNALNGAVAMSTGEYLLFIDCDVRLTGDGLIGRVAEAVRSHELVDVKKRIVGDSPLARIVSYEYLSGSMTSFLFNRLVGRCPQFNGACFAIRRSTFNRLGGFRRVIYEDLDLAFKAYRGEVSFRFADDIVVENVVNPSIGAWLRQRKRWGVGLVQWLLENAGGLAACIIKRPHVFLAALLVLSPSAPLLAMSVVLPDGVLMKLLSLILLLLSSLNIYLVPSVLAAAVFVVVAKSLIASTVSFLGTGLAFALGAKRLGYSFNPLEFTVYFLVYSPVWFILILVSLVRVALKREPSELDWKV